MPAYRFTWDAFNDDAVAAFATAYGYDRRKEALQPREWLALKVARPNADFVGKTKVVIIDEWLSSYIDTANIIRDLIDLDLGPTNRVPTSPREYRQWLHKTRNTSRFRRIVAEAMIAYGDRDRNDRVSESAVSFFSMIPAKQPRDPRQPHPFQREAWEKMSRELAKSRKKTQFQGILSLPTGAGKTFTATRWLMENHIRNNGRVLWIAHRHELLQQAAEAFKQAASIATGKPELRIRIVSGAHHGMTRIFPADDVIVASIQSLARRPEITEALLDDKDHRRLFVVIDEAHHAVAKTYREIVDKLARPDKKNRPTRDFRLLGLTATPTRTVDREKGILHRLFNGTIVYQANARDLIEQGYLARPRPVRVKTKADAEAGVTEQDRTHLARFNDLSDEWLDRIAHMARRNELIVREYLDERAKYGKTIMFAINVPHARLLTDRLLEAGVRADCVTSWDPSGKTTDRAAIDRFRSSDIDVIVNVQILTEGVDLPDAQTVFLTRPTSSEILLRQMIGRALRGLKAGGTELAYIVSFEDHWERFRDWESPLDLVADITGNAEEELVVEEGERHPVEPLRPALAEVIPWDLFQATAQELRVPISASAIERFEAVPHGWYVLEREVDGKDVRQIIHVHAHQQGAWSALVDALWSKSGRAGRPIEVLYDEFFGDCSDPAPSLHLVEQLVEHHREGGERPEYFAFSERAKVDPYEVAQRFIDKNEGAREKAETVKSFFENRALVRAIYPSLQAYHAAVADAEFAILNPREAGPPKTEPIFEELPRKGLRPGPFHNLMRLLQEMLPGAEQILGSSYLDDIPVEWSRRPVKSWFGITMFDGDRPTRIRINKLLDSKDVSTETMRYLLWHEYLHVRFGRLHGPAFREKERSWPKSAKCDRELDSISERFGINWW